MKNILILTPTLELGGGAEKVAASLANVLSENCNVFVATFYRNDAEYSLDENITRVNHNESVGKNKLSKIKTFVKRIFFIKNIIFKNNITETISFQEEANNTLLLTTTLFGDISKTYPCIHTSKITKLKRKVLYKLLNQSTKTIVISKQMKKNYSQMGVNNTELIYNLFPVNDFIRLSSAGNWDETIETIWENSSHKFVSVGRLIYPKAQWHLIKSFSVFVVKYPDARLFIFGQGGYQKELESLIINLDLQENIFLLGLKENIFPYIKKADALLMSSYYEGLPTAIIESLAMATPVLSTDCISGPREILAPDVDIDTVLKYPFITKHGVLVETFKENVNFTTEINATEKQYAVAIEKIITIDFNKKSLYSRALDFDTKNIVTQWKKLLTCDKT